MYHPSILRLTEGILHGLSDCGRVRNAVQAMAAMGMLLTGVALAADQPFRLTSR
jgi:hypothetical protein